MTKEQLLRAAGLAPDEIEMLPFGAIVVDAEGTILRYNAFESQLSRLDPERVIGKNFFRDVAPCTAVRAFEGRMREFLESDERVSVTFDYRFSFKHGVEDVAITFMKMTAEDTMMIAVERLGSAEHAESIKASS
jgi:photoactive yellow protein